MEVTVSNTTAGTLLVTRVDGSGHPATKTVEVRPGERYRGYKFRRLRRWADDGREHALHQKTRRDQGRDHL